MITVRIQIWTRKSKKRKLRKPEKLSNQKENRTKKTTTTKKKSYWTSFTVEKREALKFLANWWSFGCQLLRAWGWRGLWDQREFKKKKRSDATILIFSWRTLEAPCFLPNTVNVLCISNYQIIPMHWSFFGKRTNLLLTERNSKISNFTINLNLNNC